jgi:hypothetical protein
VVTLAGNWLSDGIRGGPITPQRGQSQEEARAQPGRFRALGGAAGVGLCLLLLSAAFSDPKHCSLSDPK